MALSKVCTKCKELKCITDFPKDITAKNNYHPHCKTCRYKVAKIYRENNKEKIKQWYIKNKKILKLKHKIEYLKNKEKYIQMAYENRIKNRDKISIYKKGYYKRNKKRISEYVNNKYYTNINYRIQCGLVTRIRNAVFGKNNTQKSKILLGCSIEYLRGYLSSKFTKEMTWKNYGKYWEIDHIIPCSYFDLKNIKQQKICFHYTNLQPLTVTENRMKSNKLIGGVKSHSLMK